MKEQPQAQPEQQLNLVLSLDDVNKVLGGLGELKASISLEVIMKIQQQVTPQMQSQAPPGEVED